MLHMPRQRILILTVAVVLLVAATTAVFVKRKGIAYHFNEARAASLLEDSIEAGHAGEWKRADQLAQSAWRLRNGNVDVLRQWYRASMQLRSQYLLTTARALFEHPEANAADRKEILQLHLEIGDLVTFERYASSLSEEEQKDPDLVTMAIRFYIARGDLGRALPLADSLVATRGDPTDQLLAVEVYSRLSPSNDEAADNAQRLIKRLFEDHSDAKIALSAFALLERIPSAKRDGESFANASQRLDALETSSTIPTRLRLLAMEWEASGNPDLKDRLVDHAITRYLETDLLALAQWLTARGEAKILLQILPEKKAAESVSLLQLLIQAQMSVGNLEAADRLLANAPATMKPWIVMGLRGAIASANNERAASHTHWQSALEQATSAAGREALIELARVAARTGNEKIRNRALTDALKRPSAIPMALADVSFLFSAFSEQDNAEDFLQVSQNLLAGQPDNPLLINNVFWLELIGNRVRKDLTPEMESLVDRFPDLPALRSTLALAQVKDAHPDRALETLTPILSAMERSLEDIGDTDRAVVALALSEDGELDRSRAIVTTIDWSQMLEIERDFFHGELTRVLPVPNETSESN